MNLGFLLMYSIKPNKYVPICVAMASSLDRLEKLFSSARRKSDGCVVLGAVPEVEPASKSQDTW